ncbi:MAG: HNH endonuclease [Bacilli bacterium]|nr:HNH endonuclease [Bacilli bacterium]
MCGEIGTEVHHKVHLTPENVGDPEISINQENLMLLCNECHNKVH